jgi:hypothetical protein
MIAGTTVEVRRQHSSRLQYRYSYVRHTRIELAEPIAQKHGLETEYEDLFVLFVLLASEAVQYHLLFNSNMYPMSRHRHYGILYLSEGHRVQRIFSRLSANERILLEREKALKSGYRHI